MSEGLPLKDVLNNVNDAFGEMLERVEDQALESKRNFKDWLAKAGENFAADIGITDQFEINGVVHVYTSAMHAYKIHKSFSFTFGWINEVHNIWATEADVILDTRKDIYNNVVGRQIAEFAVDNGFGRDVVESLLREAIKQDLVILNEFLDPRTKYYQSPPEIDMVDLFNKAYEGRAVASLNGSGGVDVHSLVDGAPGDNVIGDGYAYDYSLEMENPYSATYDSDGNIISSPRPEPRPDDFDPTGSGNQSSKPLIIDMDGDGIEVSADNTADFDWDADGYLENGSWVHPDDAFLVIDLNANGSRGAGDGKINQAKEIAFSLWTGGNPDDTDLQALGIFDRIANGGNGNGRIDAGDAIWTELRIWQDKNSDGVVDGALDTPGGELHTLSSLGFSRINLSYGSGSFGDDSDDQVTTGAALLGQASYVRNGVTTQGGVGDVAITFNPIGWKRLQTTEGYDIRFENGDKLRYAVVASGAPASVNLASLVLDGAVGDARANALDASGQTRQVQIAGGEGGDTLRGGANHDMLSGDGGADVIYGNDGNDTLFIDAADLASGIVNGGRGHDTAIVLGSEDVVLDLQAHSLEAAAGGDGNDSISGAQLDLNLYLQGGAGDDSVSGGSGDDTLSGDAGNDTVRGGYGDDTVFGAKGNDSLQGQAGDDLLLGGEGADSLEGGDGDDIGSGGAGNDVMTGSSGDDHLSGDDGADTLDGGMGDDSLEGNEGNDRLLYWRGDDTLIGGLGNDTFVLSTSAEYGSASHWGWGIMQGGKGQDTLELIGSSDSYSIRKVDDNQWQIYRATSASAKVVIDAMDIEVLRFGDGSTRILSIDTSLDTSADYVRSNTDMWVGDSAASILFGSFVENGTLFGWMGEDTLTGMMSSDSIIGGEGRDTVDGGNGNDNISGSSGGDLLYGNADKDTISGGSGSDSLVGGTGADSLVGGTGADLLLGEAGMDTLVGGDGSDSLDGGADSDVIYGSGGSDLASGGDGDDSIYGGIGSDRIFGGGGDDLLEGDEGSDTLYGNDGNDTLFGAAGFNMLSGGDGNDSLIGGDDDDQLVGGNGADTLIGGQGSDIIIGGDGGDRLDGGAGVLDVVSYYESDSAVFIDLLSGNTSGGDASGDILAGFEHASGSSYNDSLWGDDQNNVLIGLRGADILRGRSGHDDLSGGDGDDSLDGGAGLDRLWGDAGNDTLSGGSGADTLSGGTGIDTASYATSASGLCADLSNSAKNTGDAADDVYAGIENLIGSDFSDELVGSGIGNRLTGGSGHDWLEGRAGADTLDGGSGWDRADYSLSTAGVSADLLTPTSNTGDAAGDTYISIESLGGSNFGDTLAGDNNANTLLGRSGNDVLRGREGDDHLLGHEDNDILDGGAGSDTLDGGEGIDRVSYGSATTAVKVDLSDPSINTGDAFGDVYISIENLMGSNNNDNLRGNEGANAIYGASGNDVIYGRAGDDTVTGDDGNDTLYGQAGNDQLYGGSGSDVFVFGAGYARDRIADFEDDVDIILLTGTGISTVGAAMAHARQSGSDVIFDFGGDDVLTVTNTLLGQLSNDLQLA